MELTAYVFSFFIGHCGLESVGEVGFNFLDHACNVGGDIGLCILRGEARVACDPKISILDLSGKMAYLLGDAVAVLFATVTLLVSAGFALKFSRGFSDLLLDGVNILLIRGNWSDVSGAAD